MGVPTPHGKACPFSRVGRVGSGAEDLASAPDPINDFRNSEWPGGPRQLPTWGSHRSVRARIRAYGSSDHGFATRYPLLFC